MNQYTCFFHPLRIKPEGLSPKPISLLDHESSIWERSTLEISNNFFYPHVKQFFKNTDQPWNESLQVYQLKPVQQKTRANSAFERILRGHFSFSSNADIDFDFSFSSSSLKDELSPKLWILPKVGFAMLSFALAPKWKEESGLTNRAYIEEFNFSMKNIGRTTTKSQPIQWQLPDNEKAKEVILNVVDYINQSSNTVKAKQGVFQFRDLLDVFTKELEPVTISLLSPRRLVCFTYLQTTEQLSKSEHKNQAFRLSKIFSKSYQPSTSELMDENYFTPFEDITWRVDIEGACILLSADNLNPAFAANFGAEVFKSRYLWIYTLALLQRYMLLSMNHTVMEFAQQDEPNASQNGQLLELLNHNRLLLQFEDIAYFDQHNRFYHYTRLRLETPRLDQELERKILQLKLIEDREIKVERDKEALNQKKINRIITLLLTTITVMTIASVWKDLSDVLMDGLSREEGITIGIISSLILATAIYGLTRRK